MRYLLDTNICIYLIKQKPQKVLNKFQALPVGFVLVLTKIRANAETI
ncbi:hypothetical protein [Desmonostoc muscorum]|nr:hypothetical protein [Desmonostoc muscorum]